MVADSVTSDVQQVDQAVEKKTRKKTDDFRFVVRIGDKSKRNRFEVVCNGEKITLRDQKQVTDEFLYQFEQEMKRRGS